MVVASFFVQLLGLFNPLLIQQIIDAVISQGNFASLNVLGTLLVAMALAQAPAAVAEGSRQDSQRGPPGNHRQIPLPPEQELIDPLLQPGDSQDDDRDQQGRLEL